MSTHDLAGLVAALTFPIVTGVDLPDAPASEAALRAQVSAMLAAGGDPAPDAGGAPADGLGIGLEILGTIDVAHMVIETLIGASMHIGLVETYEALRHWRGRRPAALPGSDALASHPAVIQAELERRLTGLGLEEDQARDLASGAVQALTRGGG